MRIDIPEVLKELTIFDELKILSLLLSVAKSLSDLYEKYKRDQEQNKLQKIAKKEDEKNPPEDSN